MRHNSSMRLVTTLQTSGTIHKGHTGLVFIALDTHSSWNTCLHWDNLRTNISPEYKVLKQIAQISSSSSFLTLCSATEDLVSCRRMGLRKWTRKVSMQESMDKIRISRRLGVWKHNEKYFLSYQFCNSHDMLSISIPHYWL